MLNKRIICLYGGPGSGKSTTCAGLFYELKKRDFDCEMNREYIKEWVWEGRTVKDGDQTYLFAKSARKERLYMDAGIDIVITDSPLVLTHFYGMKYDSMEQSFNTSLVMLKHHHEYCKIKNYKVDHFFVERAKKYNPNGRFQTEKEAKQFDLDIKSMLGDLNIGYTNISTVEDILSYYKISQVGSGDDEV
jgi:tRNA uridine 5-carbamoylmethylation protein Kti12